MKFADISVPSYLSPATQWSHRIPFEKVSHSPANSFPGNHNHFCHTKLHTKTRALSTYSRANHTRHTSTENAIGSLRENVYWTETCFTELSSFGSLLYAYILLHRQYEVLRRFGLKVWDILLNTYKQDDKVAMQHWNDFLPSLCEITSGV